MKRLAGLVLALLGGCGIFFSVHLVEVPSPAALFCSILAILGGITIACNLGSKL